jgi:hypothetical protein
MNPFLERVEPFLLSEDPFVRQYAVRTLENSYLATPDTFLIALQSHEIYPNLSESVLPRADFMPIDSVGLEKLVEKNKKIDEHNFWILRIIENMETDMILPHQDLLKPLVDKAYLQNLQRMKDLDTEALWMEFGEVTNNLEEKYDGAVFSYGKRIVKELILRGDIPQWEVENGLRTNLDEHNYCTFAGIYSIYMAGEIRAQSVVPRLAQILDSDEGDFALEEASDALIKIGTETVIDEMEKIALNDLAYFYTTDVLAKIKTKKAEQILLQLFDQATDLTAKTLIADALCQHLSIESIPKVHELIQEGYDSTMLDLEEALYANIVINDVDHPDRIKMKQSLEEKERLQKERAMKTNQLFTPVKTNKIGRNDPCPCGSGKKYKKCCLK